MASELKNLSEYNSDEIPSAKGFRFAIVHSEWNSEITNPLCDGCIKTLIKHGAKETSIKLFHVPGSFELTFACSELVKTKNYDAVIAIGCIIEGETRHFEFIAAAVANGITQLNALRTIPVIFGVLTPASQQQAIDRAGGKYGNKGVEAAVTAIKMIALKGRIRKKKFKILEH
ncbi:6,7-dimethyl-8-ribityllumazine synthase [Bacteroidota bacterium]|nr:6,7-dimethyl-8-ribityllumazine synthase [Bacteroidota bacterium]